MEFLDGPEDCMYLPGRQATLRCRVTAHLSPEEYEELMNAGWRKFGMFLFRPECAGCRECRPIRIVVDRFTPDRSQRRAWRANQDLAIAYGAPAVDAARLDLWHRYHHSQSERKGWPTKRTAPLDYALQFVRNPLPSVEISAWEGDALRAVVLTDITPNVVSGIYHYYDPNCRNRSLGTFAALQTIELARRLDKPYVYLGYYVAGCGSMVYKGRFHPSEILSKDGLWQPFE